MKLKFSSVCKFDFLGLSGILLPKNRTFKLRDDKGGLAEPLHSGH